ncbi:L10-interacting MYB domain-containing protein-like [Phragmites australis]|uniref:L10-interacting MYB domain-containing protein-like n=1 Tax=Phragmites australis TaxID=29695 RepID=UPI002D77B441|nr:L10-interacting MYB domain-containing protein-like [Phragmites australis]
MKDDSADWCDENLKIVCELFAEQVRAKNRSGSHLNRQGYNNVIAQFKERTGLTYTKLQFKNKWDKMKKDYSNWKQLGRETGAGWDPVKKMYTAPDWWWKKTNNQFKGISKFKDRALQNEDELSVMFEDLRNTGDDHWAPTSGDLPQGTEGQPGDDNNKDVDMDDDDDSDGEDGTPSSSKAKRRRVVDKKKVKKAKTSGGQWMQEHMAKIVELNERTTASCESVVLARTQDTPGYSIKDIMELVKACGAIAGTKEHFIATQIFTKKAEREMFLTLDTPEERFNWLSMKHEWMTMNKKA